MGCFLGVLPQQCKFNYGSSQETKGYVLSDLFLKNNNGTSLISIEKFFWSKILSDTVSLRYSRPEFVLVTG